MTVIILHHKLKLDFRLELLETESNRVPRAFFDMIDDLLLVYLWRISFYLSVYLKVAS